MGKFSASEIIKKARTKSTTEVSEDNSRAADLPAAKIFSGQSTIGKEQIRRFAALEVDPSSCTPWKYHNRDLAWLNTTDCSDLINSINNNGQQEPALVREIKSTDGVSAHKYEIIYGVRRWYACSQIKDKKLLVKVTNASDKECMILMHLENADSKDITDFERAYSFKLQLESGEFSGQKEMSEKFGVSQGLISRMVSAASIYDYDFIRGLFDTKLDISIRNANKLYRLLKDNPKEIKNRAEFIHKKKVNLSCAEKFSILLGQEQSKKIENIVLGTKRNKIISYVEDDKGNFIIKCRNMRNLEKQEVNKVLEKLVDEVIS